MTEQVIGTTEAVLGHHIQAIVSRNVDNILSDYTEESVVFSPNGVSKGLAQIRAFFDAAMNLLTPEVIAAMSVARQDIDGEFAYLLWSAPGIAMATDTFNVRNGKISMQSFAAQMT